MGFSEMALILALTPYKDGKNGKIQKIKKEGFFWVTLYIYYPHTDPIFHQSENISDE